MDSPTPPWFVLALALACRPASGPREPPSVTAPEPEPVPADTPTPTTEPEPEPVVAVEPASSSEPAPSPTLRLFGTITEIVVHGGDRRRAWAVTLLVEEVREGSFAATRFSFLVHSPSKSGLEVGARVELRATWVGDGYAVDEWQWR
jgi:hypothetical protein